MILQFPAKNSGVKVTWIERTRWETLWEAIKGLFRTQEPKFRKVKGT